MITSQITKLPAPPPCPVGITCVTLHSNATGASLTLGGFTFRDGISVNPAFTNSFTPFAYSPLARDIWYTMEQLTICITTSGTSRMFSQVCLVVLSRPRLAGEKISRGGLAPKQLKQLKGLRLTIPFLSTVLANAIGLGITEPNSNAFILAIGISCGSITIDICV